MIIVYGDRGETLITTFVGVNFNVPVAHFQGGDLSGNIDEIFRHTISKMSNFHFVSNKNSKNNLIKMGEIKQNIFNVGELHIDTIRKVKKIHLNKIKSHLNLKVLEKNKYVVFHYHPETYSKVKDSQVVKSILKTLIKCNYLVICLYPCSDQGYKNIVNSINYSKKLFGKHNIFLFKNIESSIYINLLRNCSFFIGNSSSGIIESPYLKKIFVNIGNRQNNRLQDENVINIKNITKLESIVKNINKYKKLNLKNLYGKGRSADKSLKVIKKL